MPSLLHGVCGDVCGLLPVEVVHPAVGFLEHALYHLALLERGIFHWACVAHWSCAEVVGGQVQVRANSARLLRPLSPVLFEGLVLGLSAELGSCEADVDLLLDWWRMGDGWVAGDRQSGRGESTRLHLACVGLMAELRGELSPGNHLVG